jgi:hypothetical protein
MQPTEKRRKMVISRNFWRKILSGSPGTSAVVLVALIVSGCATKSVDQNFAFTPGTETGLIVGSASSSDENSAYDATVSFRYSPARMNDALDFKNSGHIEALSPSLWFGRGGPSDFKDVAGKLFAIALKPGNYSFTSWEINNGSNAIIYPIDPKPLAFTVRKGKATYIGNMHMYLRTGRNFFGITIIADGRPSITDKSERDIPLLLKRFPKIAREDIEIHVLDDRPWGGNGPPKDIQAQLQD